MCEGLGRGGQVGREWRERVEKGSLARAGEWVGLLSEGFVPCIGTKTQPKIPLG